jgi:hypothetical protein
VCLIDNEFENICRLILVEWFCSRLFIKRKAINKMELFYESWINNKQSVIEVEGDFSSEIFAKFTRLTLYLLLEIRLIFSDNDLQYIATLNSHKSFRLCVFQNVWLKYHLTGTSPFYQFFRVTPLNMPLFFSSYLE